MVHKAILIGKMPILIGNIVARMALKIASCNMLLATIALDELRLTFSRETWIKYRR